MTGTDSVTASVNEGGREVRLIIHPILNVLRDRTGALVDLDPSERGSRESWMQIEVTREPDQAERAALGLRLETVLADVRCAVSDWPNMRHSLQEIAGEITAAPPPLPRAEIAEGVDFLRWLDDDNFTYLGFRDYVFPIPAATASTLAERQDGVQVRIQSSTWVPRTVLGGSDTRALGVMIDRAEIR